MPRSKRARRRPAKRGKRAGPIGKPKIKVRDSTKYRIERMLKYLREHAIFGQACRQAKLAPDHVTKLRSQDPLLEKRVQDAILEAGESLERVGWTCARKAEEDHHYIPVLNRALAVKRRWREQQVVRHEGGAKPVEIKHQVDDLRGMSDVDLIAMSDPAIVKKIAEPVDQDDDEDDDLEDEGAGHGRPKRR